MTIPSNRATSREAVPSMADKAALIDILCGAARILPVITIEREQDALPLADALAAGGLRTLEVTLRSEHGLSAIRILREQRPELCVGAGTVLDEWMLAEAEAAGSQFIVTPGCTAELLRAGVYSPLPVPPGISSDRMIARNRQSPASRRSASVLLMNSRRGRSTRSTRCR